MPSSENMRKQIFFKLVLNSLRKFSAYGKADCLNSHFLLLSVNCWNWWTKAFAHPSDLHHSSGSYPAGQSRFGGYHQHLAPSFLIFPLGTEHTELQEDMTQSTRKHDHLISQSSCAELGQLQWLSSALDSKHSSACTLNIIEVNMTWHDSGWLCNLENDP